MRIKNGPIFALLLAVSTARAATVTRVASFTNATGYGPKAPLIQASDGNFYGTTSIGGDDGAGCVHGCGGTVFKMTPDGTITVLHTFEYGVTATAWIDGQTPLGGVVEGPDGWLYGTTNSGGAVHNIYGTIYKVSKTGQFQKIHDFCPTTPCPDGANPEGSLLLASDGWLYGTTTLPFVNPRIFRISPSGTYAVVAGTGSTSLASPSKGLIQASDGNLYGVAANGIYRVTLGGQLTALYYFGTQAVDGIGGNGPLVQAADGNLYGATNQGGASGIGTVFKITLAGVYQKIHDIAGATEGVYPNGLLAASDGNLWGTTSNSSLAGTGGWTYAINTAGASQQSVIFTPQTGEGSKAGLIQAIDGKLYGTASQLGPDNGGTVFVVDAALGVPTPGEAGTFGNPMRVTGYNKLSGEVTVSFGTACGATDHHIVYGPLSALPAYGYAGQVCGIGGGTATFDPGADSAFWIVVGNTATIEGSYGRGAGGAERPQAAGLPGCGYTRVTTTICP